MNDFRPISLNIRCVYKIITKILASRLKGVLPGIISPSQTTFLQWRQILDGVLVTNEIINLAKKKRTVYMFKVDFEKAYDLVSWKFLYYVLRRIGFNDK